MRLQHKGHIHYCCARWLMGRILTYMTNQETLKRTLGERLAKARRINGWSQAQVSAKLGISRRSITRYEDDATVPSTAILIAWANICDVPFEWLSSETVTGTDLQGYLGHPALRGKKSQVDGPCVAPAAA